MDSRWISFRSGAREGGMRVKEGGKERSMYVPVYCGRMNGRMDKWTDSQIHVKIHDYNHDYNHDHDYVHTNTPTLPHLFFYLRLASQVPSQVQTPNSKSQTERERKNK